MSEKKRPIELGSPEFWKALEADPKMLAVEVCTINVLDLDKTLQQHPGLRAWVSSAFETARGEKSRAEWELTKAKAQAFLDAKGVEDPQTKKPKTVDAVKAEVELNSSVTAAQLALFAAEDKHGALKAMNSALEDRKEMLVQLSANRRKELNDQ